MHVDKLSPTVDSLGVPFSSGDDSGQNKTPNILEILECVPLISRSLIHM